MKTLKRLLLLALAAVMSLLLFACANTGDPSDPSDPSNPSNPSNPSGSNVEKYYEFDYQVTVDNKIAIDFEGTAPTEVLFGTTTDKQEDMYEPDWTINGNKIEITLEGLMMGSRDNYVFKFTSDTKSYTNYITVNPIAEHYFVADGSEASYKIAVADIVSAKFEGTDVASVAGVTKDATGLTFTKELLATKPGINTVEIKTADKTYSLALISVTKEELRQPITFEDGEMSPFLAVFGNDYKVVSGSEIEDATIKAKYTGGYKYYWGKDTSTAFNNEHALEIIHKAGSADSLRIYVSSLFIRERVASMETLTADVYGWPGDAGAGAYTQFMSGTSGRFLPIRMLPTYFSKYGGTSEYWLKVNGQDIDKSNENYMILENGAQNLRPLVRENVYGNIIDMDGELIANYLEVCVADAPETYTLYVDDIGSLCMSYSAAGANFPLPAKLA